MLTEDMVNREFTRVFKGYDVDEVEDYIEAIIELYNQIANENRELVLRCESLTASLSESEAKLKQIQDTQAQRDGIIDAAEKQATELINEARETARLTVEQAECTARELLYEVKTKVQESESAIEHKLSEAEAKARDTVDSAIEEAKKLIKATKYNCVKRTEECEGKLAAAQAEYDSLMRRAAEFRDVILASYTEQMLAIRSVEIDGYGADVQTPVVPEIQITDVCEDADAVSEKIDESTPVEDCVTDEAEDVVEQIPEKVTEQRIEDTVEETTEEVTEEVTEDTSPEESEDVSDVTLDNAAENDEHISDGDECIVEHPTESESVADERYNTVTITRERKTYDEPMLDSSLERKYAPFRIEKERSGQVQYNSSEISSVNQKLDDIMAKKGAGSEQAAQNVSKKLGFLK